MDKFLWELMEMEAPEKFFVNEKEHPAFLMFPKHHYLALETKKYNLYLNGVGLIASFRTRKQLFERLKEIIEQANFPIKVFQVSKFGNQRGKKILFAENQRERVDMTNARGPCRVFNIDEWGHLAPKKEASS